MTDQNVDLARFVLNRIPKSARLEALLADAATVADRRQAAVAETAMKNTAPARLAYFQLSRLENRIVGHHCRPA